MLRRSFYALFLAGAACSGGGTAPAVTSLDPVAVEEACAGVEPVLANRAPRRLRRSTLEHAIEDLVGASVPASILLPPDFATGPFEGASEGMTMGPAWANAWLGVVQDAIDATDAVPAPLARVVPQGSQVLPMEMATDPDPWVVTMSATSTRTVLEVTEPGPVTLTLDAHAIVYWNDEGTPPVGAPPVVTVLVDGTEVARFEVSDETQDGAVMEASTYLRAGTRTVDVVFLPTEVYRIATDGLLVTPVPSLPAWAEGCEDMACLREELERLVQRAWRAPVDAESVDALWAIVEEAPSHMEGLSRVLEIVLTDPRFVFDLGSGDTAHDRAATLAITVWDSLPDAGLMACATAGGLGPSDPGPCGGAAQLQRMLEDPRAMRMARQVAVGWFDLASLTDAFARDDLDDALRAELVEESAAAVLDALRNNRSVGELLLGATAWVSDATAELHDVADPGSASPSPVPSGDRGGVLRSAAFLAASGDAGRVSFPHRGRVVLERLICQPTGDPPNGLDATAPMAGDAALSASELRRADPNCSGCHTTLDPVGLALGGFDEHGASVDRWWPTDATVLPDGTRLESVPRLMVWLASSHRLGPCASTWWTAWVDGIPADAPRSCAVDGLLESPASIDSGMGDLLWAALWSAPRLTPSTEG